MDQESDLVYLDRRASEERRAAVSSDTRVVRDVHLEFASAYEFRLHLLRQMVERGAAKKRSAIVRPVTAPGEPANNRSGDDLIQHQVPLMLGG
jgi:hypothetical protein